MRGFYSYYWRPRWGYKKHDYEYVHTSLEPDRKPPPVRITVDTVESGRSYRDADTLLFKINAEGKGIQKKFQVKERMENSLGEIFTELITIEENKVVLFDGIFSSN